MDNTNVIRITRGMLAALFTVSLFSINIMAQNAVTFNVTADGTPVEGGIMILDINGVLVKKINPSGQAVVYLPDGEFTYSVYMEGTPESITVGPNTFVYNDIGGGDKPDSYDNYFVYNDTVTVSGTTIEDVALTTNTFNTTLGGSAAAVEFDVTAEYYVGSTKEKILITVTSDAGGTISVPLPTHRDRRRGENIYEFTNYKYSVLGGLITGAFDPGISPVNIDVPALNFVTFAVTAGDTAVEGITVGVGAVTGKTNASGQVILNLPDGTYNYSVYTEGTSESITVGVYTFTYNDIGGDGKEDSYDNIFVYNDMVTISGATAKDIALTTTTFNTTVEGSPAPLEFDIKADYSGGGSKVKTLTTVTSDATGTISLPLPTHRDRREGDDIFEFIDYRYSVTDTRVTGSFDPEISPVNIDIPALNFVTFTVTAGGTAVEGITVDVDGVTGKTNASGQVILNLPDGELAYSVYTEDTPEYITVGANTFTYYDIGGNDKPDSYDNIFVYNSTVTVSGATMENVALTTTTFNTTVEGSAAAAEFDITADYYVNSIKEKVLITVTSDAGGTISVPLPTHRDRRRSEDIYEFTDYEYSAIEGLITGAFDPEISPVNIDVPAINEVTFTVTAGDTAVEGITINVEGITGKTNASGQVIFSLPEGDLVYSVYTEGTPESITVGVNTFTYYDIGGLDRLDRYGNFFVYNDTVTVSGATMEDVALITTTFNTTVGGYTTPVEFDITADYYVNSTKEKTLITVTSNAGGTISVPLPTHRDRRRDENIYEFTDYEYSAIGGLITGSFDPEISPVNIALPAISEVTFTITAGDTAVEGITIDVLGVTGKTDASGQAIFNLHNLDLPYSVYTEGTLEYITVGANTFTYYDIGGNDKPDSYDNIFVYNDTVTVSGPTIKNVALTTTTFNTTVEGSAAAVEFDITADYSGGGGKTKTLTTVTSDAAGTINLPLPTHRDSREGDIHEFTDYMYSAYEGLVTGAFDPKISPVNIDIPAMNEVTFTVTAGDTAVEGITIDVEGITGKTNASGQVIFSLPDGDPAYSVYTEGSSESIIVGVNTFTYNDIGGSDRPDSYDNIFVNNDTVTVSGATTENVALTTTTFHTTVGGSPAAVEFSILADYSGGGEKTKTVTTVTSDATGTISLPLPTHRTSREGDIHEFTNYNFSDAAGSTIGIFDPEISPVNITLPALGSVTFSVKAGENGVEGIIVNINNFKVKTNASGQAVFNAIPCEYYDYSVYTEGIPEYITIGQNTFVYYDIGGREKLDSYDNIFIVKDTVMVSGAMEKDVALTTTTFNTTVGGSPAAVEFDITADYSGGGSKVKTLTTVTSDAGGTISLPLPTHRDRRSGDIFEFIDYRYSAFEGLITGAFDPEISPVNIDIPALNEVTFTVTAGGTAVEGITVGVEGITGKTDASGQAILSLPDGDLAYSVYTEGSPEYITVGANTFMYKDIGGRDNPESYDNIFVYNDTVTVSGATMEYVTLTTTTFNTTVGGSAAAVEFDITADYIGGGSRVKTLTTVTSDATGTITLPLPTHRDRRRGENIYEFIDYRYLALGGLITGSFDPEISPVNIDIPALSEVTFTVTAGGTAVEGITIDIDGVTGKTDASGQAILSLPDDEYNYSVYTEGTPESITIGPNTFVYDDIGGADKPDSYDNIFVYNEAVTVSGATMKNVALTITTFNTTVGGSPAAAEFDITADYIGGGSKVKTLTTVTSDAAGTITLPLPTHRDRRSGDIMVFIDYMYSAIGGQITGAFDPEISPVNIDLPAVNEVTFTVTAGGTAVEGITIDAGGVTRKTNASGQAIFNLPDGLYNYSVYTDGTPESITVGVNTFTYNDIGGDGRVNSYDNIFVYNETVTVSGATMKNVALTTTTFNTMAGGSPAPLNFSITADYIGGGGQTKTLTTVTSGIDGTISLPLPTQRTTRYGDIHEFINYMYSVAGGLVKGTFDPEDSPVIINLVSSNKVTFTVTNDKTSDPILGAIISVNGVALQATDINGLTTAYLSDGFYLYSGSKIGYEDLDYTYFTVSGTDLSVPVSMTPATSSRSITFIITDITTSNPIQGGIISINGVAPATTDASGQAVVYLINGSYSYTIAKDGYQNIASTPLTVSGTNLSIPISMTASTGVDEWEVKTFICYPNPASEFLTVEFAESYTGIIEIWSIRGRLVMQQEVNSELTRTINVSAMQSGFYILRAGTKSINVIIK